MRSQPPAMRYSKGTSILLTLIGAALFLLPPPIASASTQANSSRHHARKHKRHRVRRHRSYVHRKLRAGTVTLPASKVLTLSGNPSGRQVVVLTAKAKPPRVGGTLTAGPSRAASDGLLGTVKSRHRLRNRTWRVVLIPATLTTAYKSFHAHLDTTFDEAKSAGKSAAASSLSDFAPPFTCSGAALPHPITTHVDLSKMHLVLDVTSQPSIDFLISGSPRFDLNVAFAGTVTCSADALIPIPIADTGIIVDIGPKFTFSADGSVGANFSWTPRLSFGYFRSKSSGNYDTHVFHNGGAVTFTGGATVDLYLALETDITLAGRVGVSGTIGPDLTGSVQSDLATGHTCFGVDAAVKAELTAFANILFANWSFDLFKGSFGRKQLYQSCKISGENRIVFDGSPGTEGPPETLGPYHMTPFPLDSQELGEVEGVDGPTGRIGFSATLNHEYANQEPAWLTWSNGYTGDVYANESGPSVSLILPEGTRAFYLYAEPDHFATFNFTVTAQDGTTSGVVPVYGEYGATYFGFYARGGATLTTVTVECGEDDYAIGEFGISSS